MYIKVTQKVSGIIIHLHVFFLQVIARVPYKVKTFSHPQVAA